MTSGSASFVAEGTPIIWAPPSVPGNPFWAVGYMTSPWIITRIPQDTVRGQRNPNLLRLITSPPGAGYPLTLRSAQAGGPTSDADDMFWEFPLREVNIQGTITVIPWIETAPAIHRLRNLYERTAGAVPFMVF